MGKVLGAGFLLGKVLREGVSKNALKQKVVIRMVNRHLLFDFQEVLIYVFIFYTSYEWITYLYFSQEAWRNVFSLLEKLRHPNIVSYSITSYCFVNRLITEPFPSDTKGGTIRGARQLLSCPGVYEWWGLTRTDYEEDLLE